MQISAKVITNANKNKIINDNGKMKIYICQTPEKGRANKKIIDLISNYYEIPKSNISITRGIKSNHKIFEIINENKNINKFKKSISKKHCFER